MNSILQQIEHAVRQGPRAVERLIAVTDFPHVNGRTVTFLYNGEGQEVALQHGIHGLPGHLEFRRLQGSSVWILQIDVPPSSRMEYKIAVANMSHLALIRDPLNHNAARDPFGANSVVYGDGYLPPDWSIMDADARRGTLETRTMSSSVLRQSVNCGSICRRAFASRGGIRCSLCTTALITCSSPICRLCSTI